MRLTAMIAIRVCKHYMKPRRYVQLIVRCWPLSEKQRLSFASVTGGTPDPEIVP